MTSKEHIAASAALDSIHEAMAIVGDSRPEDANLGDTVYRAYQHMDLAEAALRLALAHSRRNNGTSRRRANDGE